jgi:uncharacterized membrane protein
MQPSSTVPLSARTARYLLLGRVGFFGLWLLQPLWILWLAPPQLGSPYVLLGLLWLPLWLPLFGIIKGHAYTMAWANFIVMIYFIHSLTNLWVSNHTQQVLALLELLLACLMFIGCTYYARYRGQELGLKIPKLKDDPRR